MCIIHKVERVWHDIGGFGIGIAFGWLTKWLLTLLRSQGAKAPQEMALTVAMAYLVFYLANAPGHTTALPHYACQFPVATCPLLSRL